MPTDLHFLREFAALPVTGAFILFFLFNPIFEFMISYSLIVIYLIVPLSFLFSNAIPY